MRSTTNRFPSFTVSSALVLAVVVAGFGQAAHAIPVIFAQDNFNDNSLNSGLWTTALAFANSTTKEQNQRIELLQRGYLNTAQQLKPSDANVGGLIITGQWTFATNDDFMQILTRSSGTPGGSFGETTAGVEFRAFDSNNAISIAGQGGAVITGGAAVAMPGGIATGDVFDFTILDDGFNLSFTLTRVSNPLQTVTVTGTSNFNPATNFVTFHNRENSNRQSFLDDVTIASQTLTVPEPATATLGLLTLGGLMVRRRRMA